ncbi:MAG: hypothetical protein H7210_00730 [Pyrinomonadaceae bacterium]|nr:hypothetical protein [Phycisphaerales bacterium]
MKPSFLAEVDVGVLGIAGGIALAGLLILCMTLSHVFTTRQREQTRREIAAYVAEGSMTPDDGAKILSAEPKSLQSDEC